MTVVPLPGAAQRVAVERDFIDTYWQGIEDTVRREWVGVPGLDAALAKVKERARARCRLFLEPFNIRHEFQLPEDTPAETLSAVAAEIERAASVIAEHYKQRGLALISTITLSELMHETGWKPKG